MCCVTAHHTLVSIWNRSCGVTPPFPRFLHTPNVSKHSLCTYEIISFKCIYTPLCFIHLCVYWLWTNHSQSEFSISRSIRASAAVAMRSTSYLIVFQRCQNGSLINQLARCNLQRSVRGPAIHSNGNAFFCSARLLIAPRLYFGSFPTLPTDWWDP